MDIDVFLLISSGEGVNINVHVERLPFYAEDKRRKNWEREFKSRVPKQRKELVDAFFDDLEWQW